MESKEMIVWPNYKQKIKISNIIDEFNRLYAIMLAEVKTKKTKKEIKEYYNSKKFLENISNKANTLEYINLIFDECVSFLRKKIDNYITGRVNELPKSEVFDFAFIKPKVVKLDIGCIEVDELGKLMCRSGFGESIDNIKVLCLYRKLTDYKVKVLYEEREIENVIGEEE